MRKAEILIASILVVSGCATPGSNPTASRPTIERLAPANWPSIVDDLNPKSFSSSGQASIEYLQAKENDFYRFGSMQIGKQRLIDTIKSLDAILSKKPSSAALTQALKKDFDLFKIHRSTHQHSAHYSSYYQPVLKASKKRTKKFAYPIYKKPADMISARLPDFGKKFKSGSIVGRVTKDGKFKPYFSRRDIDVRKELKGKGLEIAWLKSSFDRLNLHIQGSGLLQFTDGTEAMAQFAATNALPYKSVGMTVVGSGAMTRSEITSEKLRQYLNEHPEGEAWLISQNPRYTFFSLRPLKQDEEPSGVIGRPLTAGRSIAIDPRYTPYGAVAYVSLPMIQSDKKGGWLGKYPATRFVHCQDTGGAIKGPARIDLYMGHGPQAKATAHNVWEKGDFYILLKKLPGRDR
jgi:membrane-bound lytic murein transglycosylase A